MQEKQELWEDVQISIAQIDAGDGVNHDDAKTEILKRLKNENYERR